MQLILYNKDTFRKDIEGVKGFAIVNIGTKHYDRKVIIVRWLTDRVTIELEDMKYITIDNDSITLATAKGSIKFEEIDTIETIGKDIFKLIANVWGLITKLWGDK